MKTIKDIAKEFLDELWNQQNTTDGLLELIVRDIIYSSNTIPEQFGLSGLREVLCFYNSIFEGMSIQSLGIDVYGSTVITAWNVMVQRLGSFENRTSIDPGKYHLIDNYKGVDVPLNYHVEIILFFQKNRVYKYIANINLADIYNRLGLFPEREEYPDQGKIRENKGLLVKKLKSLSPQLTSREVECLSLCLYGLSAKQISCVLSLSYRTIEAHIYRANHKLNCCNKKQCFELMYENFSLGIWHDLASLLVLGKM